MAKGLFSLISPLTNIRSEICRKLEVRADSQEDLLVSWLNELIFIRETENLLFRSFRIDALSEIQLKAKCFGETVDPLRHVLKMDIKGATYHRLSILKDERGGWRARVILDV
jgi:SHS2 domain-containing protein